MVSLRLNLLGSAWKLSSFLEIGLELGQPCHFQFILETLLNFQRSPTQGALHQGALAQPEMQELGLGSACSQWKSLLIS